MIDLSDVSVTDHHCHPYPAQTATVQPQLLAQHFAFAGAAVTNTIEPFLSTEEIDHLLWKLLDSSVILGLATRELATYLGCAPEWQAVVAKRNEVAGADYRGYIDGLLRDAQIGCLIIEDGPITPRITPEAFQEYTPVPLQRVARLENYVRDLLAQRPAFDALLDGYHQRMAEDAALGVVALKSLIAYRTGLDVHIVDRPAAKRSYEAWLGDPVQTLKPLRDYLLLETVDFILERDLWLHLHTGVGDVDIVYERANPGQLFPFLKHQRVQRAKICLIHGGYPWVSEAAGMAAVLPNLYIDFSVPTLFALSGIRRCLRELLEICPTAKLVYGSDGSMPETYWLAAKRTRRALEQVLQELVDDGFLTPARARSLGEDLLHRNAADMYGSPS
jgi:hypothetical protein